MTIGENIKRIRKLKGITISTLSEQTGYSLQHISCIERNKCSPRLITAIDIADALGVTIDELVGREVKGKKVQSNEWWTL